MRTRPTLLAAAVFGAVVMAQQPALQSGLDLGAIDKSVRPQDDFFRYVNGGWLARTGIPADKPAYGAGQEVADRTEASVRAIIEAAAAGANRPAGSVAQQVGDLYTSFMDEARADQLGAAPIQAELRKIEAIQTATELAAEAGSLSTIGVAGPVGTSIDADSKDATANVVYLRQGGTTLPDRDFYLNPDPRFGEIRVKYQHFLSTVFTLAGRTRATEDARTVLDLETSLARLQWTQVDSRDAVKTYNKYAMAQLTAEMPGFDWPAWAKAQGLGAAPNVIVAQPSFCRGFAAMVPQTPLATWKAWLAAQYLTASAAYLSKPFVDAGFEFFGTALGGQQTQRPRWKRAVQFVNTNLGEAVGRLYVERHFPPAAKSRMQKLIANLVSVYHASIADLDWMASDTKKEALDKLGKLTQKVGYPDRWRSYDGLLVTTDDLLGNVHRALRFENDFQTGKVGKPVDRALWPLTPQTVNGYYNPLMNEVVFPAAILQPPFFNDEADDAVNYGGIGAVIGHEIGHAFDDQGRRFDGSGVMRDWWKPSDEREFQKRAVMLIDQFNLFSPVPGMHVNGQLTLGENIGDLGGLTIAYKAYELSLAGQRSSTIDGLTGEQRLFMGWAQVWRSKERPEFLRQVLLSNPHAPAEYRANNPLSNLAAFYEAFGLKPGDRLYRDPKDRVKIW